MESLGKLLLQVQDASVYTDSYMDLQEGRSNLERDIMTCSLPCSVTFEESMYVRSVVVLWVGFA